VGLAGASRLIHDPERAIRAYRDLLAHPGNDRDADLWKELGHTLREVERLTEAEEAYEQAIQLGREDSDLFWGQANVLAALNQDDRALHLVELLLQREPQNPLFLRRKGQLLMSLGKPQEGLATLKSAVQGSHGDPHVHFEVARALRAHGSYADAVTYYRQGLQVDSNSRIGRLGLAETLQLAGQYNEVVPIVDTLLKEDPNDLAAWQCRADAYRSLGRPQEVLYSLKAVLLLDPNNSAGLMEKYRLHLQHGESAEAFESLDQLLKGEGPEAQNAPLLLQHGDLAGQLGKVEEANRSYERAAQLDPAHLSDIAVRRARVRLGAGRPDLALEILDTTLAQAPAGTERSTSVLLLRAEILNALERPTEAHQVFQDVVTRDPKSEAALAGVARSLLDQGHHAEAKEFLRSAIPGVPPNASLFLMLAEAESGLGSIPDAIGAVLHGVEQLPKSAELWSRLGELYIARESWAEASNALAHGIALDPSNPNLLLRAGFVAEKLGHPNEAFSLYDHATQVAPQNKNAWTSRGLSLLSLSRAEEGQASFERALALDPEFEPAKEGKKASLQKAREIQIDKVGREALLLEARLRRSVTKNDLFVTLHVPFDLLDPVLAVLSRTPKIEIESLSETELKDLEGASYRFITAALERRPEGIERRGFTLADVAVLSPPNYSLLQIQRLFGYVKAVLEADLRPENLRLAPDVEELVRKAFTLIPDNERTLFQIVRTLKVGIFKARLIKVVESAGTAVHAPLPALDLGEYASEFQGASAEENRGEAFFQPENVPAAPLHPGGRPATTTYPGQSSTGPNRSLSDRDPALTIAPLEGAPRCAGCGGIASVQHECGTPLCQHCIAQFHTCPMCGRVVTPSSSERVGVTFPSHRAHPPALGKVPGFSIRSVLGKGKAPKPEPVVAKSARMSDRLESRVPDHTKAPEHHKTAIPPPPASPPVVKHPVDPTADAKLPPRPAHGREKTDDEPRL
jgi:tetratricopeptide (TPR) repeat protein